MLRRAIGPALVLATLASFVGCARLHTEREVAEVQQLLNARSRPADPAAPSIEHITHLPMTRDAALRYALVSSPSLRAEYARLGIARADVVEISRLPNPSLGLARLEPNDGGRARRTYGLGLPLADLLMLRSRTRLAEADYERAKLEVADALVGALVDVERHWFAYVGARQVADLRAAAADGLDASAELARRYFDAGNISELRLNLELAAATEARIRAVGARADALRARLALNAAIGLSGSETDWEALDRLTLPVPEEDDVAGLLALAGERRLDLLAARREVEVLEAAVAVSRAWRWLGGAEIGYEVERESDGVRLDGPTLGIELPIFNQGQGRIARAEFMAESSRRRLAQLELDAEVEVLQAAEEVRVQREIVELHRGALVPQRELVVTRSQQEQNYMLIGVFELIQAKALELDAYQGYLEAVRDYWLARMELTRAVGSRLPSEMTTGAPALSVEEILGPPPTPMQMDHSGHGHHGDHR